MAEPHELECSFCRKPKKDVGALIAGPEVSICNECVELCNEILKKEEAFDESVAGAVPD